MNALRELWAYWWIVLKEAARIVLVGFGFGHLGQLGTTILLLLVGFEVYRSRPGHMPGDVFSRWDDIVDSAQAVIIVAGALFVSALLIVPWRLAKQQAVAAAERDSTIKDLKSRLGDSERAHQDEKINLKAQILMLETQLGAGMLPDLGHNELRHPNAPTGPGTMLWRWSDGDVVGPFCPIHKSLLLYRFVGTTGPFDDESWMGSGGAFYCPTDNQEVFRYGIENHGAKVKNLRQEVRQRFKGFGDGLPGLFAPRNTP